MRIDCNRVGVEVEQVACSVDWVVGRWSWVVGADGHSERFAILLDRDALALIPVAGE
jgi:hypothetical protein